MRRIVGSVLKWDPICLDSNDIEKLVRFHKDESVDVAMIDVQELIISHQERKHIAFYSLNIGNFAGKIESRLKHQTTF